MIGPRLRSRGAEEGAGTRTASTSTGRRRQLLLMLQLAVVVPTIVAIAALLAVDPGAVNVQIVLWILTVAVVEALPVPAWHGLQLSVAFPLLMVVAFIYPPEAAALAALVGSLDPRELRREVGVLRALFNRCQVALSILAASAIFHALASLNESNALVLIGAAMLAAVADYSVNSSLITLVVSVDLGMAPLRVVQELRIGRLSEFLISYLGLASFGLFLAKFYERLGFWSVPVFVLPLLLARQMFFRSKALEEAHKELQDREQVLRALSNRMAEERQDERAQIAAFLHDDLAQLLFKLSLQVDIA